MSLSCVLDGITFVLHVLAAHVEDHGGSAAVLNCCVASELDQVRVAQQGRDVVACLLDFLDLLDSEAELGALCRGELVLQGQSARCASTLNDMVS